MSSNRKQQLYGMDAFQTTMLRLLDWCRRNAGKIAFVLLPTLFVIIAVFIGQMYLEKQKNTRLDRVAAIDQQRQQALKQAEEKRKQLQTQIDTLQQSEQDKKLTEALNKQLAKIKPKQEGLFIAYHEFFKANSDNAEGWSAGINACAIATEEKRFAEAKEILQEVLRNSSSSIFYQTQGRILYVKVLEELGELDLALEEIDKGYNLVSNDYKPRLLLIKGRILIAKKQNKQATSAYERIISEFADSQEANRAKSIKMIIN